MVYKMVVWNQPEFTQPLPSDIFLVLVQLVLYGIIIQYSSKIKYLGLTLDQRLI